MSSNARLISVDVLLTDKHFVIPAYQRPYSWGSEEIQTFLSDLGAIKQEERHLFGMVVLTNQRPSQGGGQASVYDVVDGQQRITTCFLLLSACADEVRDLLGGDNLESDLRDQLVQLSSELGQILWPRKAKCVRLKTENESSEERDVLELILRPINKIDEAEYESIKGLKAKLDKGDDHDVQSTRDVRRGVLKDSSLDQRKVPYRKAVVNHGILSGYLIDRLTQVESAQHKADVIDDLVGKLLHQLQIVEFVVQDEYDAFKLFETMNDRGMSLSALDLIKNLGLQRTSSDKNRMESFKKSWDSIFNDVVKSNQLIFLRYASNLKRDFVTKSKLYQTYKEAFSNSGKVAFEMRYLTEMSGFFHSCVDRDKAPKYFTNEIFLLKTTSTKQWVGLGMALLYSRWKYGKSDLDKKFMEALSLLYVCVFTQVVRNVGANVFETFFPEQGAALLKANENDLSDKLELILSSLKEKHEEIEPLTSSFLQKRKFESNASGRMVLYLAASKGLSHGTVLKPALTLEHIYPQKPKSGDWSSLSELPAEESSVLRYSLGNFLLLDSSLNPAVGNGSYEEKKEQYQGNSVFDPCQDQSVKDGSGKEVEISFTSASDFSAEIITARTSHISMSVVEILSSLG